MRDSCASVAARSGSPPAQRPFDLDTEGNVSKSTKALHMLLEVRKGSTITLVEDRTKRDSIMEISISDGPLRLTGFAV